MEVLIPLVAFVAVALALLVTNERRYAPPPSLQEERARQALYGRREVSLTPQPREIGAEVGSGQGVHLSERDALTHEGRTP